MKARNKTILLMLGSAFLVGTASAQEWTINNVPQDGISLRQQPLIESSTVSAIAIDPSNGKATIKTATPAGTPSVSISAAPASVSINGTTTVSWSTSGFTGAINCTRTSSPALSGWSGSSTLASGSVSVTMPGTAQTVSLTLSCTGLPNSASNSTNVAVTQPGVGVDCSTRPPGYNSGTIGVISPRTLVIRPFFSLYKASFPGPPGQRWDGQPSGVADGTVLAFEFVAPAAPLNGFLELAPSTDRGGFGVPTTGFSECPGYIVQRLQGSPTALDPCWGGDGKPTAYWTLNPTTPSCLLTPGKTYYFNITLADRCLNSNNQPANCGLRMYTR